ADGKGGEEPAQGREGAGVGGPDDARDAGLTREGARVERTRPAVGDEGELPEIVAALDGDQAEGAEHVGIGDLDHAVRRLDEREPEARRERSDDGFRPGGIEANGPAVDPLR